MGNDGITQSWVISLHLDGGLKKIMQITTFFGVGFFVSYDIFARNLSVVVYKEVVHADNLCIELSLCKPYMFCGNCFRFGTCEKNGVLPKDYIMGSQESFFNQEKESISPILHPQK